MPTPSEQDKRSAGYRVSVDIHYLDGLLEGLTVPAGHTVTVQNVSRARSVATFLARVRDDGDFIRAAVTGYRYVPVGDVVVDDLSRPFIA